MNMLSKISILVISGLVVLASSSIYVISEVERRDTSVWRNGSSGY